MTTSMAAVAPLQASSDGAVPQAGPAPPGAIDAPLPPAMAARASDLGVSKAGLDATRTFVLAVLAGAFIALGAMFATVVTAGAGDVPFGLARLAAGVVFCLGLLLVVVAGAELFTGNNLIVMAWADRRISAGRLLAQLGHRLSKDATEPVEDNAMHCFVDSEHLPRIRQPRSCRREPVSPCTIAARSSRSTRRIRTRSAPRKRPLHTIIPGFMQKGDVRIGFGIMGGFNQAQAHAQFVANIVDYGLDIQQALEAGRFTKTTFAGADVNVEALVPEKVRDDLAALGHEVTTIPPRTAVVRPWAGGDERRLRRAFRRVRTAARRRGDPGSAADCQLR